jgi:hypothetical protein
VFAASPFYDASATQRAPARLSGFVRAAFHEEPVSVEAPWTERIPYQDIEHYQQPYTQTEHYTQSVPVTRTESYTYSCGTGTTSRTCHGTRTRTEHRTEFRTRTVTRYRTATRMVTRYRHVPRVFTYAATRVVGRYDLELAFDLRLDEDEPVIARVGGPAERDGLRHDVSFDSAGVAPSRPSLPSVVDHFVLEGRRLEERLPALFAAAWRARYCRAGHFSVEEAARCVRATDAAPPPPVVDALAPLVGARDVALLAGVN